MKENGSDTLSGLFLKGVAARFLDSKAIIKSTQPAGLLYLNASMKSAPKTSKSNRSNSWSMPAVRTKQKLSLYPVFRKCFVVDD